MGIDVIAKLKLDGKELLLGYSNARYDQFYACYTLSVIEAIQNGAKTFDEIQNASSAIALDDEWKECDVDIEIDYDEGKVKIPMLSLEHAEDFESTWGVKFIYEGDRVLIDWGEGEVDELLDGKEEIDKIYPLLKKEWLSFEELATYCAFFSWCEEQPYSTFEYCDMLVYHYEFA